MNWFPNSLEWPGGSATASGQSMLEAAFITPLLLLLTFAIVDFSALLYVHLALENGVSQAIALRRHRQRDSRDRRCRAQTRSRPRCGTRRRR